MDEVLDLLKKARVTLLMKYPFFGTLAQRLVYQENNDWCKTAAVDGKRMYFNREFIKSLSKDEVVFLIAHELLHLVFDHLGRTGGRDKQLSNMAQDYLINYVLVMEGVGTMPQMGLYDKKYNNSMTSEEIYEVLVKDKQPPKPTLDVHLDITGKGQGNSGGNGKASDGKSDANGHNPNGGMTSEEIEEMRQDMKGAVIQAAQAAKMAGKLPASMERFIDDLVEPKVPWQDYVNKTLKSLYKENYSFARPSRRTLGNPGSNIILPSRQYGKSVDVAVCLDMSGSIGQEEARAFLSEVKGMMDIFKQFKLTVWTWDTKVYNPVVFTRQNADELFTYEIMGGGGTCLRSTFEFMKNPESMGFDLNSFVPDQLIVFTDGYIGDWGDPDYCDTLFLLHGTNSIVAPYGQTVYYDDM